MKKSKVLKKAAKRAAGLFAVNGWEWVDGETSTLYVPTAKDIKRTLRRLVKDLEARDPVDGVQSISTGRLVVFRYDDYDGSEYGLCLELGSFYNEE
jgi:hypothetical protein